MFRHAHQQEDDQQDQRHNPQRPVQDRKPVLAHQLRCPLRMFGRQTDAGRSRTGNIKDDQADEHPDHRGQETVFPTDLFPEKSRSKRSDECSDVDAHVKDRKAYIAARIVFGIYRADHRGDVGLEKAVAHDQQAQPCVKQIFLECHHFRRESLLRVKHGADGQRKLSYGHQQSTHIRAYLLPEPFVCQNTTNDRRYIDQPEIDSVDGHRFSPVHPEPAGSKSRRKEQEQHSPHRIEAETLANPGGKDGKKSHRLPEKCLLFHF